MIINKDEFFDLFSSHGININENVYNDFYKYSEMLVEWNKICNLTAILDPEGISLKHFFDSVYPFSMFEHDQNAKIIDIGAGAGFPSLPLAIVNRNYKLTLLDSLNKRIKFLTNVAEVLKVSADCVHGRAEEFGKNKEYREKFDIATARAVAPLNFLCEYCMPFVKVGGRFVALKGASGEEEVEQSMAAIKILGGKVDVIKSYSLPNGDKRTLIIIKKISHTQSKYPRNKSQMTKKPL